MATTTTAEPPQAATAMAAAPKIQWASAPGSIKKVELEEKLEAARSRNWITERMIEQSQKHWHCSREAAIERLLAQTGI